MPGRTTRPTIAWLLTMAVPLGALCAPFLHAHVEHEREGHHGASAVHAHLSGHDRDDDHSGPSVREGDHDRAIYLTAYVAERSSPPVIFTVPSGRLHLSSPGERCAHPAVIVTHGHDPPLDSALGSRPPPTLPVLI